MKLIKVVGEEKVMKQNIERRIEENQRKIEKKSIPLKECEIFFHVWAKKYEVFRKSGVVKKVPFL